MNKLTAADFPLVVNGQYVYRRTGSGPLVGPISMELAADLASRLNREEAARQRSDELATSYSPPTGGQFDLSRPSD